MSKMSWSDEKLIFSLLNNKTNKSRWENIRILRSRPSKELFAKCVEFIQSNEQKKKMIGIDILAQLGKDKRPFRKETLKIYFGLLNTETDIDTLFSIFFGISFNNDSLNKKQINKICSFQNTDNILIKQALVAALGFVEDENAIHVLIKFSEDKANRIRDWATFYLGQIDFDNEKIRKALWNRVHDKHRDTKMEAIAGLARRNDDRVIDIIKQELVKDDYTTVLFEAILETQNKDFLPLLHQAMNKTKNDSTINSKWLEDLKNCYDDLSKK